MPKVSSHTLSMLGQQGHGRRLHRGALLTPDERQLAIRLRGGGRPMPWDAVSRAVGRTVTELRSELDPTFQKG